ncbi:MAG: hypothetical protein U1E17_09270 [Geminicoccaceae bacterium]
MTKWAVTVREPGLVPRAFQQAFHLMRSEPAGAGADRSAARRADGRAFEDSTSTRWSPCRSTGRAPAAARSRRRWRC